MPVTLKARDVMDTNVHFIDEEATIMDAIKTMLEKKVWSLVITRHNMPIGVVTERDILRRAVSKDYDLKRMKVKEIASSPLITVDPDTPLGEVMKLMVEKSIRRVYVVEGGKIIGRVTQTGGMEQTLNVLLTLASLPYQL